MIKFEFDRENTIEFEVIVGNTDHVSSPAVRFGIDVGSMHLTFDAIKGKDGAYAAIIPETIPVDLGKTYSCFVEIIIGTKRFVPFNDSVTFDEGIAPKVKITKTKPAKPKLNMKEPEPTTPEAAIDKVLKVKESVAKPERVKVTAATKLKKSMDVSSAQSPMELVAEQELEAKAKDELRKKQAKAMVDIFKENSVTCERVVGTKVPSIAASKPQLSSYTPKRKSIVKENNDYVINQPLVKIRRTGLTES